MKAQTESLLNHPIITAAEDAVDLLEQLVTPEVASALYKQIQPASDATLAGMVVMVAHPPFAAEPPDAAYAVAAMATVCLAERLMAGTAHASVVHGGRAFVALGFSREARDGIERFFVETLGVVRPHTRAVPPTATIH